MSGGSSENNEKGCIMRAAISDKSIKTILNKIIDSESLADKSVSYVADVVAQFFTELMMTYEIEVGKYVVVFWAHPFYTRKELDEAEFERVFDLRNDDGAENAVSVIIADEERRMRKVAFIVPLVINPEDYFVSFNDNVLFVINDTIYQFDPEAADFVHMVKIENYDPTEDGFYIHLYKDDMIIYGETQIFRIDKDLNVKWSFSGRDAFDLLSREPQFKWKEDRICIRDYSGNRYEIDYDGNLISEVLA